MQAERASARVTWRRRPSCCYARIPALERELAAGDLGRAVEARRQRGSDGQRGGRPGRHRRRHRRLDRHPRRPAARGRDREAAADGGRARAAGSSASRRPSRAVSDAVRRARAGIADPDRPTGSFLFLGPDRRRQDRAGQGAGGLPVRRRAGDGPHRHERVLREALGGPACRCAARLRRLRRGRPADRGGPPPAVLGDPARRGREGAPGRLRHPAAGARRRPADRRPGPHGRLPQHDPDPDVEPGQPGADGPGAGRGAAPRRRHGGRPGAVQAGVPQPARRHRGLPRAGDRGARRASSTSRSTRWAGGWPRGG